MTIIEINLDVRILRRIITKLESMYEMSQQKTVIKMTPPQDKQFFQAVCFVLCWLAPPIPHCSRVRTGRYLRPIREERCAGVIRGSDPQPVIPSAAAAAPTAAPVDGWRGQ